MISLETIEGSQKENLLDVNLLKEGQVVNIIAYVLDCKIKIAATQSRYISLYLKDKNATVIRATMFDLDNSDYSCMTASAFKGKIVNLTATVQEYYGSMTLLVDSSIGISLYTGQISMAPFIGKFDIDFTLENTMFEKLFPGESSSLELYKYLSIDFLCNGKVGAFAKMVDIAFGNLLVLPLATEEMLKVFFRVVDRYYTVLFSYKDLHDLERLFLYKEYTALENSCDKEYASIAVDTLSAVLGSTKPLHLYSHLIYNALLNAHHFLELCEYNNSMVLCSKNTVYQTNLLGDRMGSGIDLLKY